MKDEIKEILDDMKIVAEHKTVGVMGQQLNFKNARILLDYITNLQEENESLKELNVCVGCNNNLDYKSRNEKAIEYIEERSDYISSKSGTYYMCYAERNIVLDILKGGDEE